MAGLFISYRRDDQAGFAGRLSDALIADFGAENVFRDVDDIRPGEDFVAVLEAQLRHVDAMLVVIGPAWLRPDRDSKRRIDAPDDFVRREIHAGLIAGCPLFPVLVAGAVMPNETDLPNEIRSLARHQAVALSDLTWTTDLARLIEVLTPTLRNLKSPARPAFRRWRIVLPLLVLSAALMLISALFVRNQAASPNAESQNLAATEGLKATELLAGRWSAEVTYDWGARHEETFVFEIENKAIHGSASYLKVARTIENAVLQNNYLTFTTHSEEILGDDERRTLDHKYRGTVQANELRLTLETSGSHGERAPVKLLAKRLSDAP